MSADAWLKEEDARELLELLGERGSARKLRLVACGCVRLGFQSYYLEKWGDPLVNLAERVADGEVSGREREQGFQSAQAESERHGAPIDSYLASAVRATLDHSPRSAAENAIVITAAFEFELCRQTSHKWFGVLVREVFGNPFRPIDFAPWRTDTAIALAVEMYKSRDFSAMPILADALQDAGCDNEDVLAHCRDPQQSHVRGCWVVDGVLGKE